MKRLSWAALASLAMTTAPSLKAADVDFSTTVRDIHVNAGGYFVVRFSDDSAACTNANSPKRYLLSPSTTGMTAEGIKYLYAAILYALSQDKQVIATYDDSTTLCRLKHLWVL